MGRRSRKRKGRAEPYTSKPYADKSLDDVQIDAMIASARESLSRPIVQRKTSSPKRHKSEQSEHRNSKGDFIFIRQTSVLDGGYHAYIVSDEWKEKARAKRRQNSRCSLCNRDCVVLNVHHRTYVRLGSERDDDLTVLCEDCHSMFHKHFEYNGKSSCFTPKKSVEFR